MQHLDRLDAPLKEVIAEIQHRVRNSRVTNLIYLHSPVAYTPVDPARQVAQALSVEPISVMGLLCSYIPTAAIGSSWCR